ncbi:MAG: nuclear transport factor 2 family protein [Verrucomicrobiota bacterium]
MKLYIPLVLVLFAACTSAEKPSSENAINESETKRVLDHHWATFQGNDLEGTMADYTEESVLITPDKTFRGLTEIRENFVNAFRVFPKDSATLKLNKSVVTGDVGYILWEANTPTFNLTYATDTFIIQNGKIVRQTYAGVASPK